MAKAYKCDKCGKYYSPNFYRRHGEFCRESKPRYIVYELDNDGNLSDYPHDLCGECQKELDDQLSEFFKIELLASIEE